MNRSKGLGNMYVHFRLTAIINGAKAAGDVNKA